MTVVPVMSTPDVSMDPQKKITMSVVVDLAMIVALATLSFWVGRQADRIDTMSTQLKDVQATVSANDSKIDVAALKERTNAQNLAMIDLKDTLIRRLDRMESKIDKGNTDESNDRRGRRASGN